MKEILAIVMVCAVLAIPLVAAAVLAFNERPGWGWFLLVGMLLAGSFSVKLG